MEMKRVREKGVEITVLITPYHPDFLTRLKSERADIYDRHRAWIAKFEELNSSGIQIVNYFDEVPRDDGSSRFWNDGVHFTCHSSILMLKSVLKSPRKIK